MFKVKLFSLFIAFALIVTVGGVYATWNYAEGNTIEKDYDKTYLGLTEAVDAGARGALSIAESSNLSIMLDDANNDHVAEVVPTGSITIVFTPNQAIAGVLHQGDVKLQFVLNDNANLVHEGNKIFNVYNGVVVSGTTVNGVQIPDVVLADGVFTWTIPADVFASLITLNGELALHTSAEYETVESLLIENKIGIVFDEYEG